MPGSLGIEEQKLEKPGCCLPSLFSCLMVLSLRFECPDMLGGNMPGLLDMVGWFVHCKNATS